jgi:hypothetical protein
MREVRGKCLSVDWQKITMLEENGHETEIILTYTMNGKEFFLSYNAFYRFIGMYISISMDSDGFIIKEIKLA